MKQYQHLFFDLDHTLWDFNANSTHTLKLLFEQHALKERLQVSVEEFLVRYYQVNDEKWAQYRSGKIDKEHLRTTRFLDTFKLYGFNDASFSAQFDAAYIAQSPYQTRLIEGTLELLQYLVEKDIYKLHIITNGFNEIQDIKLKNSGLYPFFEVIMTSEKLGVTKPHAKIFMEALQQAKATRKNSLMIGDNLVADILGARNCGIDQVYFNPQRLEHKENITFEVGSLHEIKSFL
jgi:putative hydrolase of the HAD superfamily